MRTPFIFGIVFCASLSGGITSAGIFSKAKPKEMAVRTTAYTHTEADHIRHGKKTAAGGTLQYSRKYSSAAADWSKFPLGTRFKINGMDTTFVVDDYGSALVGTETIDIYKPSKSAMNDWGVKHVDIKILEYGDFEKSREILEQRTKYSHVRKMLAGINKNPGPKTQKKPPFPTHKPFIPAPPKVDLAPVMQLASAPPAPKPVAKSPTLPTPPAVAPPPMPAPLPKPEPTPPPPLVASAPAPLKAAAVPAPTPRPTIPAPAIRKVQPLQLASLSRASTKTSTEPVAAEAPVQAKPAAAAPSNQLRKREFRPLLASVNG